MSKTPVFDALIKVRANEEFAASSGSFGNSLVPPIYMASAFSFESTTLAAHHRFPTNHHRYLRDSSPNTQAIEEVFNLLHPGFSALAFSSGMAAISSFLFDIASSDRVFIQKELYRKTRKIGERLSRLGVEVSSFDFDLNLPQIEHSGGEVFVFVELPSNPHLRTPSIAHLRRVFPSNAIFVLDATFSGLGNLTHEILAQVDALVYSLTKYVGGHNDLLAGMLLVRDANREKAYFSRSELGTILDPVSAFLLARSLETFDIRFATQVANAQAVLEGLSRALGENKLEALYYPGRYSNKHEESAVQQSLVSSGAVLSFVPSIPVKELRRKIDEMDCVVQAPSFGSNVSLIEIPADMSYAGMSAAELEAIGVEQGLVRLSVGVGDVDPLVEALLGLVR